MQKNSFSSEEDQEIIIPQDATYPSGHEVVLESDEDLEEDFVFEADFDFDFEA